MHRLKFSDGPGFRRSQVRDDAARRDHFGVIGMTLDMASAGATGHAIKR
jgi:hypothetical protein